MEGPHTASPRPEHLGGRALSTLVDDFDLPVEGDPDGVEVTGITISSRDVQPGDIFAALAGSNVHGASFVDQAVEAGAVAIVTDRAGAEMIDVRVPVITLDEPRASLGELASWVYRNDGHTMRLFGITGTNGKTTTAFLLESILQNLGFETGLSTTAERHIGDEVVTSRLTTPEASELHGMIARMREVGVRAAVLEVSAQAIERYRVEGIRFDVVGFTNLTHDHLDDYGTMEDYFKFKLDLFTPDRAERGVVCLDTDWGRRLVEDTRIPVTTISSDREDAADWTVEVWEETAEFTSFTLTGRDNRTIEVTIPFIGRHMAMNTALAILMLVEEGFDIDAITEALDRGIRDAIPGRLERVSGESGPRVFVDYGHSPDAFEQSLKGLRAVAPGRLVMIFGADGDRDATKRRDMGRVAATHADAVVVTDYNPRFEDPASIREQVLEGVRDVDGAEFYEVSPEEDAIRKAIEVAGEDGTVLWCGPGEVDYREVRGMDDPFSAREEARRALREAGWTE
ncbi:MAG TPA: UDP-N-acetylmuramoyl-L-alanyl-D-glutamate--2,6-diaminopimelate ligase [Candidatus Agrococcus pullicola]|uniref:UDP-N-acetylmuramyl-tripeptide synthetase n=1 Tax=Candidatus Agrococcus pullicola TaxID=2838429 RepID=A0A9D1Z0A4_9MICO|nr:UDP-N-acetylmuramoyl-L-alanyl-D-glutamate--2,6-diaminopimelate ligase [Candidatus Agrococcus pullicola]